MRGLVVLFALAACDRVFGFGTVPTDGPHDSAGRDAAGDAGASTCFEDPFDGAMVDTSRWDVSLPPHGGAILVQHGQLAVDWVAAGGNNYGDLAVKRPYDMRGGVVEVDVDDMQGDSADAELIVAVDAKDYVDISVDPATFTFEYSTTTEGLVRQNPVVYMNKPLRLSIAFDDAGDVTYMVTTSGGTMMQTLPVGIAADAIVPGLAAGTYDVSTQPGTAVYDNFRLAARSCGL